MATEKDLEWAKENMPIGRKVMVRNTKVMAKVMTEPKVLTNQATQETRVCVWITNHNGWFPIRELSKAA
jgi:flagellar hook assembly protein FlgD